MNFIYADKDELGFPLPSKVLESMRSGNDEPIRRYQKEPAILKILAEKHGVPKERIFIEYGVIGIIHRVFDAILNKKSEVLLPALGYPYYYTLAKHHNSKIKKFEFIRKDNKFSYNKKDLLRKVKKKPSLVVLIDPESPLGFSIPEKDIYKTLKASHPKTLVILDQSHEGFRETNIKDITKLVEDFPNLLVCRGFSKFYGLSGMRMAYALCGKNVKKMINFKDRYLGFNNLSQKIAMAALQSEEQYEENAKKIRKEKSKFYSMIRNFTNYKVFETDHGSVVVEVPENQSKFLAKQAEDAGIFIRHLGDHHDKLKNFYKITMCLPEETDRIIDLFSSISWLYGLKVHNSDAKSIIHTRDAGYTIHRKEIYCKKSGILVGVHRVIVPPGKNIPAHRHPNQDEFFEFYSNATFELNGKYFKVKPGDLVNIKPGDTHYIEAPPDKFARFVAKRFPYVHEDKYTPNGKQVIHEK